MTVAHDPGGKVRLKLGPDVMGDASMSPCGTFRYSLERWRGDRGQPYALWIGMNPSTADAEVNDPTVAREWGFTTRAGLYRMMKRNVSPYRATSPKDMVKALSAGGWDAEHRANMIGVVMAAQRASIVVMAHGILPKIIRSWGEDILRGIRQSGVPIRCLGLTKDGWPRHPLYVPSDTPFGDYEGKI